MGLEITRDAFEEEDYRAFARKLDESTSALEELLARPGFGRGPVSLGSELELHLVGADMRPSPVNRAVLADTFDPRLCVEVDRFNLEINARPCPLRGRPFHAMEAELESALAGVRAAAARHGARTAVIGILPTLRAADLESSALTDMHRYRALSAGVRRIRREPFRVHIIGRDELELVTTDVTFEGANTSFQVHLRVEPAAFAAHYNAAQIATAVALSVASNSPFFLGKSLWDETRIALFRQSVDDRSEALSDDWRPARVSFGHGWVRHGALELFQEAVALHEPLLPVVGAEEPRAVVARGEVPRLDELRLHHGTVWRWNRAVYDAADGGHLRIELRALPAGPTVRDMVASAALLVGLTLGLAADMERTLTRLTFGQARRNFYEAARQGIDAALLWPTPSGPSPKLVPARELIEQLVPVARDGLVGAGVLGDEADEFLRVVSRRLPRGASGAAWQRRWLAGRSDSGAFCEMLARYIDLSEAGVPVAEWPDA
jgi:hypothetical protein